MKRSLVASVALLTLLALGAAGCATTRKSTALNRPRSFVLAVTVHNSLQPTPQQWSVIQARFSRLLAARGWVLVNDITLADHIMRVNFTPDPTDPEVRGHATVLSIRANPRSTVARQGTSPYPSSALGYSNGFGFSNGFGRSSSLYYSNSYYGYGGYYDDGYSSGSSTYTPVVFTPPPTTPPLRHHPGNRDDCPPGQVPSHFAGNYSRPVDDHPRPPPSDYGRWSGERTSGHRSGSYSRSDNSSYSHADRSSYSRADSYTPSQSYSEPSYSSSSHSDYSSSANSSSSAAVSAVSSSAPAVEAASVAR
jgi:hypothetical protein